MSRRGNPPPPLASCTDPPLVALMRALLGQHLVVVSQPPPPPPNARAYVQHKKTQKCSLILPRLGVNARCVEPLPFKLPTLDILAHLLQLCTLRGDNSIIVPWTSSIFFGASGFGPTI